MRVETKKFRFRSCNTLVVFLSFLAAVISGVALYLRPEGSLARWMGWELAGLDKKQWEAAHMGVVLLFMISSFLHIWYNFKALVFYLRGKAALVFSSGLRWPLILETTGAVAIVALVFTGAVALWTPFSNVVHLRNSLKDAKYSLVLSPPIMDADKLTVADFCRAAALDTDAAVRRATARGVVIEDLNMDIGRIAQINRMSPENLYQALRGD
ncbi:MAG: hypothetical protein H6Q05_184 [Acidobacteria bacterium]|jgi:hypothetical protein|nr:hypothetical protein [Acidobacteriota bacterium]